MDELNNDQFQNNGYHLQPLYPPFPTSYPYVAAFVDEDDGLLLDDEPETAAVSPSSRLHHWMSKHLAVAVAVLAVLLYHFHAPLYRFWICHRDTSLLFTIYDLYCTISDYTRAYLQMAVEFVRSCWRNNIVVPSSSLLRFTRTAVAPIAMPELEVVEEEEQHHLRHCHYQGQFNAGTRSLLLQDDLEPAFLREEDYPSDWMVYHPALGVVLKTIADNYQKRCNGLSSSPERNGTPEMVQEEVEEVSEKEVGLIDPAHTLSTKATASAAAGSAHHRSISDASNSSSSNGLRVIRSITAGG